MNLSIVMATDIDLRKDIEEIKKSLDYIKNILAEKYKSGDDAKSLPIIRKAPISKYKDQVYIHRSKVYKD